MHGCCERPPTRSVFRKALGLFTRAVLASHHARPKLHFALCHAAQHLEEVGPSREIHDALLDLWPDSGVAAWNAGCAVRAFDPAAAAAAYEKALELEPDDPKSLGVSRDSAHSQGRARRGRGRMPEGDSLPTRPRPLRARQRARRAAQARRGHRRLPDSRSSSSPTLPSLTSISASPSRTREASTNPSPPTGRRSSSRRIKARAGPISASLSGARETSTRRSRITGRRSS